MDELLQEFIAETRESLEAIAGEVVAWEADPADRARLDAIFRFVHTVKGSCGFLDLPRVGRLAHAAEDALAAVRAGERVPDPALVNAVLAIVDRIGAIVAAIDAGAALEALGEEALIAALDPAYQGEKGIVPAQPATIQRGQSRSIRLSVDLLDRMMNGVSEMVLVRNELAHRLAESGDQAFEGALDRLSHTVAELQDAVTRTRMQTVDALFSALPRVVRDTAAELGKQVTLTIDGGDVELDREMIELLRDPLVHMVRNALDHGIETPAERRAAGKRDIGRLAVSAHQSGNRIIVEIADDGRGVDTERLVAGIVSRDPMRDAELRALSPQQRLELMFEAGVSSRDIATATSGRGVGMDVVRTNVEQIGGSIALLNRPGQGLTVSIEVPLTLAILSAVVVEGGGQTFALPRQAVHEIVATAAGATRIDRIGDGRIVTIRDRRLPLIALDEVLGLPVRDPALLAVLEVPGGSYALGVDTVIDTEEVVVKPASPAVMRAGVYAGMTLPDSGHPMLLLDAAGLAEVAGLRFSRIDRVEEEAPPAAVEEAGIEALLFEDIDGRRRAIPLAAISRIEPLPAASVHQAAGQHWLSSGGAPVRLVSAVALRAPADGWSALRLPEELGGAAYPVREPIDIVRLPTDIAPAAAPLAGVALIEGEAIELIDPLALGAMPAAPRLCLLHGAEAGWMEIFLKPAIEAAGYRVVRQLAPGEMAEVALAMDGEEEAGVETGRLLRLGRTPADPLYRYDRAAVVAALEEAA
ncbi:MULTISPECIES: chemotaxis protein CheA [Sphingomonas]|uniref:Chemotaxis protein CheA n=1 Tax=Sphingomonas lycopersici TaxID=2951807 RepID=A0AA42CQ56_9SPHN|nr:MULTISPECIES: chemotaxis protein CheW [Sphingomonas]MCW6534542.1 chemotaxis protein CheW [Sphingomonas lycopersici]OJU22964.1 MAG: chemotaxis protein CheA [Sphingomonas sp. 66-10]